MVPEPSASRGQRQRSLSCYVINENYDMIIREERVRRWISRAYGELELRRAAQIEARPASAASARKLDNGLPAFLVGSEMLLR